MKSLVLLLVTTLAVSGCVTNQSRDFELAQNSGVHVFVKSLRAGYPNSAGGVDAHVDFSNSSAKTLKYVVFEVTPYNRVGDVAPSEIGRKRTARLRATGPYKPGRSNTGLLGGSSWGNVWYNHTIRCIELERVEVTFMSGGTEVYEGSSLRKVLASHLTNSCSPK